jgi:predicted RNA-binding protein YlqC (UPF0109 family)
MKQLLEYIIPNIVNHPEDVTISEEPSSDGTSYIISVNPEDMGRVIGKSGKVIKAIRQIAHIMAVKRGVRIHIDVLDRNSNNEAVSIPEDNNQTEDTTAEEIPAEPTV